jgi:tRNA-splicing ligase RtcB
MSPHAINPKLVSWASDIDDETIRQAERTARLPIVAGHVALMPDAHVGIGATVGSVVPTKGAIIPSCVGVDIGCGMAAVELDVTAEQLPDDLGRLLHRIESVVPAGVGRGHALDARSGRTERAVDKWFATHRPRTELSVQQFRKAHSQFGSLGSGNHFVEVCLSDQSGRVWVVLHSGSRGIGNQLAEDHIKTARRLAKDLHLRLEDPDLAWFVEGTREFEVYVADMLWAQEYARANRDAMLDALLAEVISFIGAGREIDRINCHHNYCVQEKHGGKKLWITRKGAIRAGAGERGIIPGSMGTASYIVSGLGSAESWESCSHGAGRKHSRSKAKRLFTTDDLARQMAGKVWLSDKPAALLDEIPSAYKDIEQVMADQADLVAIENTLQQVLNYKGT